MTKHTPGPWSLELGFDGDNRHGVNADVNTRCRGGTWKAVAIVEAGLSGGSAEVGAEEAEANARLITAAPEMFDLCLLARDVINDDLENRPARHSLGKLHARLTTVIAKVTGDES